MALIANVRIEYAYALQDLGSLLEQVNVTPTTDVRDRAISAAIAYYTRRMPRLQVILVSSVAGGFYPVPADWIDVSRFVALEFPLNATPPMYYSPRSVRLQPREGDALYYYPDPNPGSQFRLIYTSAHGATVALPMETAVGSVQADHEAILGQIAASIALREYADRMAGSVSNNLDGINYRSKSKEFTDAADALTKQYDRELSRAEVSSLRRTEPFSYFKGWA